MAEVPTPWIAIVVSYGEGNGRLYWSGESRAPEFFMSEGDARVWAENHCRRYQDDMVLIARATHMAQADVAVNIASVSLPSEDRA